MIVKEGAISIVIPTRNRRHLLITALESVSHQSVDALEIIVVDQQSEDDTVEELRHHNVTVLMDSERGAGHARNMGFRASRGEYVMFLDSDDWLAPCALEILLDQMTPETHITYGRYQVEDLTGRSAQDGDVIGPAPVTSTSLLRRAVLDEFGVFDGDNFSFPRWIMRNRMKGLREKAIHETVAYRRIHDSNISVQPGSSAGLFDLIRAHRSLREGISDRER